MRRAFIIFGLALIAIGLFWPVLGKLGCNAGNGINVRYEIRLAGM